MSEFGGDHGQISATFLRRSRAYLSDGALLQASEKGWGAAAHAVKIYAAARELTYINHDDFRYVITELRLETHQDQIRSWESSANSLHQNFYDDDLSAQQIGYHLNNVAHLVDLIREITGLPPVDC